MESGSTLCWREVRSALHWQLTSKCFLGQTQGGWVGLEGSILRAVKRVGRETCCCRTLCPKDVFAYSKLPLVDFHIGVLGW